MINSQQYDEHQNSQRFDTQFNKQNQTLLRLRLSQQQFNHTWKLSGFKIIAIVLKFISAITKQKFQNSFNMLNHQFFKLLKDSTADYHYYLYRGYFQQVNPQSYMRKIDKTFNFLQCNFRRNYIKRILQQFLLEPDDIIIIVWNIYFLLIVTINVFYVSLRLSFIEIAEMNWDLKDFIFEQLPSYSLIFEIIIKFNTCIYSKGVLIKNRKRLIKRYLKREFLIDMLLIIPFFIGRQLDFFYLDLVILLKMIQISKLTYSLFNRLELTKLQTTIFELVKLIFFILLCAHFSACIWHKLGTWGNWGNITSVTWLKQQQLQDSLWIDKYIVSFYWSIVTMTTIGYGDITPVNLTERLFCIIMTLISTATFAYSVNSIGQIFQEMSKQSSQFKANMNSLNKYLKSQKVSPTLQIKFRRYFEYFWSKPSQELIQFQDQIPQQLKNQMIVEINIKLLKQLDIFKQFSSSILNTLCLQFQEQQLQPDEYLFKSNYRADKLYIFVNGQIQLQILINNKKSLIEKIKTPCLVGQLNFFLNTEYNFEAIATKNTKILTIDRESLIAIVKQSDIDYEIYKNFEDDVKLCNKYDKISNKCSICSRSNHQVLYCPFFRGCISKTKVLYHLRHNIFQHRQFQSRNNEYRRISTKQYQFHIMESVLQYIMQNDELCSLEGIKKQFQAVMKQQQQYEEKLFQTQSNQLTNQISLSQNIPINYKSNSSQFQNQNFQKNNSIIQNLEVLSEKQNQFGILSKTQDIRLITTLNNQRIQPILEESQKAEGKDDGNNITVNISQQFPQINKQENSILPSNETGSNDPYWIQQRSEQKCHSMKWNFEKQRTEYVCQKNQLQSFKSLHSEREDYCEKFPKQFGFNKLVIATQMQKKEIQEQQMTKNSLNDYIYSIEKLQEKIQSRANKLEESHFGVENQMSQSVRNSTPKSNIEISQVNINNDQQQSQEKDFTNQFLEDLMIKNKLRFVEKQVSFQESKQNQHLHFPEQEFKALEQSMITQYEKLKQKEEQLKQQIDRQQTVISHNKEQRQGLGIKITSDDSSDEDSDGQKLIRGQYLEIFNGFERVQEYQGYYPNNNISQILLQFQKNEYREHNFMKKRNVKKDTIMNLLKQAQNMIRKSQQ
ncbi:unnamed protein product (macronuclear) [Paramecium tetraurelia]|uniref:Cyclic nucleotide-binding domain-containing protein n=1 Tax=Paramecium tetraurelia TaxID=5888 RepID=A0CQX0_PARTE|nr:uncharacterized protein GSPATT00009536001 [Paramecium tetraurelia]CAK73187.1 unnamed protein product [Paramecium tetraurelia]|eukprot:XP_001440584.1 hypothetical protein (macronuclear) [Paramecium tetraurelia strain d4-2]